MKSNQRANNSDLLGYVAPGQDALALSFCEANPHIRYVAEWNQWMVWDGKRWQEDETLAVYDLIRHHVRAEQASIYRDSSLSNAQSIAAIERLAKSDRRYASTPEQWDGNEWLLGTPNGTVDLRTGKRSTACPEQYITQVVSVAPSKKKPERWIRFLDRVFCSEPEVIPFLQRWVGYALTGKTSEHKMVFAYGTGRNGKSVFLNSLMGLWGDYAKGAPINTFLDSGIEQHPTDLAGLRGARLVTTSEVPPKKYWNEAKIKALTGGDPITARKMRQNFSTFVPQFKLMISGNELPSLRTVDAAIRARVLVIPFKEWIPEEEQNLNLLEDLKAEWPAILQWAIEGAIAWDKEGLQVPESIRRASEEYLDSEDIIREFIRECVVGKPGGWVAVKDLHRVFQEWRTRSGSSTHLGSQTALTRALRERSYEIVHKASGNGLSGYSLRSSDADTSDTSSNYRRPAEESGR